MAAGSHSGSRVGRARPLVRGLTQVESSIVVEPDDVFAAAWMRGRFEAHYDESVATEELEPQVALIPFLLDVAPIAWLSGRRWSVPVMDRGLAESLEEMRAVLARLYPGEQWRGELVADELVSTPSTGTDEIQGLLFSGGVDSTYASLVTPGTQLLISVRGADISLADAGAWETTLARTRSFAGRHGHRTGWVASNFKEVLRHDRLNRVGVERDWWGQVQHALALVGLTAPALRSHGATRVMLASSLAPGLTSAWGSHPDIDHRIAWADVSTESQGASVDRLQKVRTIVDRQEPEFLRVCWESREHAGHNCGACEKCLATAAALLLAGADPAHYGLERDPDEMLALMQRRFRRHSMPIGSDCTEARWRTMRDEARRLQRTATEHPRPDLVAWLATLWIDGYRPRALAKDRVLAPLRRLGIR